jgi:integrase
MTTRTTNRPGTMRERPEGSGNWQLRAFIGNDPVTGRPHQASRTFHGGERAAAKALTVLVSEVEAGKFDRTTVTVGQLLDKWIEATEPTQRPRTVYENRRKIEGRLRPVLGHVRLDRLEADVIDAAYRSWLAEGLSPTTVHKYHSILSAACRQAVKWGWIDRAPTDRSSPPAPARHEMLVPTPEQLSALVAAAEERAPVLAAAVALAALTGARRGELVALRWSDVDLEAGAGFVRIAKSLTVSEGVSHVGPTKTHQSRVIALDEFGVAVLTRHRAYMTDLSTQAESPLVADPYVLSYNANGGRSVNPDTLTHRFGALCEAMQAKGEGQWSYRFHDLRHFSVTTLIAAGVDVRTVSTRHGHASATMTLNRYAHALPERDREAAGVLGRALGR